MNNQIFGFSAVVILVFIAWVGIRFDFALIPTIILVIAQLIAFGFALLLAIFFLESEEIKRINFLPLGIVGALFCFRPALNYLARQEIDTLLLGNLANIWYINIRIQFEVAITILVLGHITLYALSRFNQAK